MMKYLQWTTLLILLVLVACSPNQLREEKSINREEFVPTWAKTVVWYQIFPERFRDGDPTNNPTVKDILDAEPAEVPGQWQIHPWESDWYQLLDYEIANGEPELWKHLLRRRYGGDLQGIIDQLDYLQDLGITAIYLNPVFQSPSLHKYDAESLHHIDPNFGPDPEGDRKLITTENPLDPSSWVWTSADKLALQLIDEVHKRGMKIIFDGVFNHIGYNSFAFQDVIKNQALSPYKDWFVVHSWDDAAAGTSFDYQAWFGHKSLPEFNEDSSGLADGPKKYIYHAVKRWMNPGDEGTSHGVDGWRLDVAFCIVHPFWKEFRTYVHSINPEAYLTAEIVDTPEAVKPYLQGDEFDGEMNYNFAFTCAEFFFNTDSTRIAATDFDQKLKVLREFYPNGVASVSQNLFGSHDANRIGSHIVNRSNGIGNFRDWGNYFGASIASNNPDYSTRKPTLEDLRLQQLFVIMQMTYVGAPMVYYGDEVGMWGGNDPDCRKPMLWNDLDYNAEIYDADGSTHLPDSVEVNTSLFAHYKKLIHIRNAHPSLQIGTYKTLLADDEKELFVFERSYEEEKIIVLINNSEREQIINLGDFTTTYASDLMSGVKYKAGQEIVVPFKWGLVLKTCTDKK